LARRPRGRRRRVRPSAPRLDVADALLSPRTAGVVRVERWAHAFARRHRRAPQALARRTHLRRGAGGRHGSRAHGRVDERRRPGGDPDHRPRRVLVAQPGRAVAQGRHLGPCAAGPVRRARLRRRRRAAPGGAGGRRMPHRRAFVLRHGRHASHGRVRCGGAAMTGPVAVGLGETWPRLDEFVALGATHRIVPVVRRVLADTVTPVGVYRMLAAGRPGTFILESAQPDGTRSRFSFVGVRSRATLTIDGDGAAWHGDVPVGLESGRPPETIRAALAELASEAIEGLPPLTGGLVGALGWDIIRQWERTLPANAPRELDVPDGVLLLATDIAAIDHVDGSVWLIANAVNADAKAT